MSVSEPANLGGYIIKAAANEDAVFFFSIGNVFSTEVKLSSILLPWSQFVAGYGMSRQALRD